MELAYSDSPCYGFTVCTIFCLLCYLWIARLDFKGLSSKHFRHPPKTKISLKLNLERKKAYQGF